MVPPILLSSNTLARQNPEKKRFPDVTEFDLFFRFLSRLFFFVTSAPIYLGKYGPLFTRHQVRISYAASPASDAVERARALLAMV